MAYGIIATSAATRGPYIEMPEVLLWRNSHRANRNLRSSISLEVTTLRVNLVHLSTPLSTPQVHDRHQAGLSQSGTERFLPFLNVAHTPRSLLADKRRAARKFDSCNRSIVSGWLALFDLPPCLNDL